MTLEQLEAIDAIQRLKARYCRTIDAKDWDGLGELFTPDAQLQHGDNVIEGRDAIVGVIRSTLAEVPTAHSAHTPVIDVTSATTAAGNWSAIYTRKDGPVVFGQYDEAYERDVDGQWRIVRTQLTDAF